MGQRACSSTTSSLHNVGYQAAAGDNRPLNVETTKGEQLLLNPDGSMTIPKTIFAEHDLDNGKEIKIQVRSIEELKKMLPGLKRRYPGLDIDKALKHATPVKEYIDDNLFIPLNFGGDLAGKSIIKSCLALVYKAGRSINDCEHVKEYLLSDGKPCFGYYNETDVVRDRPSKIFFHCIYVCGNPITKQILAYVEYFGYQRIIACLSSNYDGPSFFQCYAVDPIEGKQINIDIHLECTPRDIEAIYAYEKVNYETTRKALNSLMEVYMQQSKNKSMDNAIKDAEDFAFDNYGAKPWEKLSEEDRANIIRLFCDRLQPYVLHLLSSRSYNDEELRNIVFRSEDLDQSTENEDD